MDLLDKFMESEVRQFTMAICSPESCMIQEDLLDAKPKKLQVIPQDESRIQHHSETEDHAE